MALAERFCETGDVDRADAAEVKPRCGSAKASGRVEGRKRVIPIVFKGISAVMAVAKFCVELVAQDATVHSKGATAPKNQRAPMRVQQHGRVV